MVTFWMTTMPLIAIARNDSSILGLRRNHSSLVGVDGEGDRIVRAGLDAVTAQVAVRAGVHRAGEGEQRARRDRVGAAITGCLRRARRTDIGVRAQGEHPGSGVVAGESS